MSINDRMTAHEALTSLLKVIDETVTDIEKNTMLHKLTNQQSQYQIGKLWMLGFIAGTIDKMFMQDSDKTLGK
jgi:hypothetical protein